MTVLEPITPWENVVQIGDCTLYQGDCLKVMPFLTDVDAVVTDPPYGMDFQSNRRGQKHSKIQGDSDLRLLRWVLDIPVPHSKYVFMRWDNLRDVPTPKSLVTWVKDVHSMGDLEHEHGRQTEVCCFFPGEAHRWPGKRPNDVIRCPKMGNDHHPTEKPIGLMSAVVSWTEGTVCDPFMGSGTTGVACARDGRSFIGIEREPKYFEIACRRIEEAYRQPDLLVAAGT